jgi:hypothetical protein
MAARPAKFFQRSGADAGMAKAAVLRFGFGHILRKLQPIDGSGASEMCAASDKPDYHRANWAVF